MEKFTKAQILKTLNNDLMGKVAKGTGTNTTKQLKSFDYVIERVQKYLKDEKTYELVVTNNHINLGVLLEIVYKASKGKTPKWSPKGEKDLKGNSHYSEIKALINPSNCPQVTIDQLNNNKGIKVLTLDGVYNIESSIVIENWEKLSHRKGNHYLTIPFVRMFGKLTSEEF